MIRADNHLYRAVRPNEDSMTELLVNLMRRRYAMEIILRLLGLNQSAIDLISFDDIHTQVGEEGVGRPDIVIENPDVTIFVEVKTRQERQLEESQLRAYPDHIIGSSKKHRQLIYLIPSGHPAEPELQELCSDYNQRINTSASPLLRIVTWDDLLDGIAAAELHKDSSVVSEVLSFISEHVRHMDIEVQFTAMEIALMNNYKDLRIAAKLIFGFRHFICSVSARLDQRLEEELGEKYTPLSKPLREQDVYFSEYGVGAYLDEERLYVGITFHPQEHADYAFSVGFYPPKFKIEDDVVHFDDECYYKSIDDKYALAENDQNHFIDVIVNTVKPYYTDKYLRSTST